MRFIIAGLILCVGLAGRLTAQNVLFAQYDKTVLPVRAAHGHRAIVEVDGKRVVADGGHYALRGAEEYLPVFVDIRNLSVKTRHLNVQGSNLNREFIFHATLNTAYDLKDVFLVLELNSDSNEKNIFLQEVGDLEPGQFKTLSAVVPLTFDLGPGKYQMHLFVGGREVLQSKIPQAKRETILDRMTARRIAGVTDAAPTVLTGPEPGYPEKLLKTGTQGSAVISVLIGANGQVHEPVLKSASDPAFGKSALEAIQLWRFLPRVVSGHPTETRVDVPFTFTPPQKHV
jgi:TonB family protein